MTQTASPIDTLLHVGDLHFGHVVKNPLRLLNKRFLGNLNLLLRRGREFDMNRAAPFAEALTATGIRELLFTGDFSSTSTDEEFATARGFVTGLQGRGFHVAFVPGNHDVYTFEAFRKRRFEYHFGPFLPEKGYPAQYMLPGGTPVILVPTACPNLVSARGRITDETIEAVSALLRVSGDIVIVAGHYPFLPRTETYNLTPGRRLRNAEALRKTLGTSGQTVLYLCGHTHRFSYTRDPAYPKLSQVSTGAFFGVNRREKLTGEFSEIHIHTGGFSVFRHTHAETWSRREIA